MSTQGNGGIYSKFQERLRKIRLSRLRKKKRNEEFIHDRVNEIREEKNKSNVVIPHFKVSVQQSSVKEDAISEVILDIRSTVKDRNYTRNKVGVQPSEIRSVPENIKVSKLKDLNVDKKDNSLDNKSNSLEDNLQNIRENKPKVTRRRKVGYVPPSNNKKSNIDVADREKLLREMGADIIDKIKSSFEDKLDELDVLESELYVLAQLQKDELELKKVKELKRRINEIISKINVIISQYNLYKKNYYLDNVIDIDDSIIVEDIINYRDVLDSFDSEKKFVKEYKALDEFKALYQNLVEIKKETEKLQLDNEEKINKYQIRDKKHDALKLQLVSALDIDKKCSLEIERQNKYFKELTSKVGNINSHEYITTHLRGMSDLLGSSFRFMGLLLLAPLTGLIPGISLQTLAARRMVINARKKLHYENVKHVYYDAVNYDSEINRNLTDVNYAYDLVEDALWQISRLREDFMLFYNSKISGYEDTLKKVDQIEKKLIHNQNRIAIVKKNLKKSQKLNEDKLVKVKQLNDSERNS